MTLDSDYPRIAYQDGDLFLVNTGRRVPGKPVVPEWLDLLEGRVYDREAGKLDPSALSAGGRQLPEPWRVVRRDRGRRSGRRDGGPRPRRCSRPNRSHQSRSKPLRSGREGVRLASVADPYLVAIFEAVERGAAGCPRLSLALMSGDLVSGVPSPSSGFAEGSAAVLQADVGPPVIVPRLAVSKASLRAKQAQQREAAESKARGFASLLDLEGANFADASSATLSDARVLFAKDRRGGVALPVLRVNLDAVACWWTGDGEKIEVKDGNWILVGGVTF